MMNEAFGSNPWVVTLRQTIKPRLRLFCFPYAGAGASIFRPWRNNVLPEVELCIIQLPGRESRILEKPFYQMDHLVLALEHIFLPYLDDLPFAFFGHSMGSLI